MKTLFKTAVAIILTLTLTIGQSGTKSAVRRVETEEKLIALTFDDGPHPTLTKDILETLEKYNAHATFFIIGKNAGYYPDALRMAIDMGHEIGNHTLSHKSLTKLKEDEIKQEITGAEDEILLTCGAKTKLFRPPEGCCSKAVMSAADSLGYSVILWNIDTKDWARHSTKDIVENIKKNVKPGSIILFHDYISGQTNTNDALSIILPYLTACGYRFVTVSELMEKQVQKTN